MRPSIHDGRLEALDSEHIPCCRLAFINLTTLFERLNNIIYVTYVDRIMCNFKYFLTILIVVCVGVLHVGVEPL